MDYTTAEQLVTTHKSIIGKKVKNYKIEYMLIVPEDYKYMNDLMANHQNGKSNTLVLSQFDNFDVWVISEPYDLAGVCMRNRLPLSEVLRQLNSQH